MILTPDQNEVLGGNSSKYANLDRAHGYRNWVILGWRTDR